MKVLVTGGAGYIGSDLVYGLNSNEKVSKIIILDNLSRKNYSFFFDLSTNRLNKVSFVKGDILDSRTVSKVLKGVDVVYHLAAKVSTPFADQDPHYFEQVNHWGTVNLLYEIEKSDVSRFIYLSSASVYGSSSNEVTESTPPDPKTFYGISKLNAEKQVERLSSKIDTYIIRCGNVYGLNSSARFDAVINKFMFEANFYNKISVDGDGRQHRAFIHIDQLISVLTSLINSYKIPFGTYNLVSANWKIAYIAQIISEIYPELEVIYVNQDIKLRELKVHENLILHQYLNIPEIELKTHLIKFADKFCF